MIKIKATLDKTTKNALRYAEVLEPGLERAHVGTVYLLKKDFPQSPKEIEVTIEEVAG